MTAIRESAEFNAEVAQGILERLLAARAEVERRGGPAWMLIGLESIAATVQLSIAGGRFSERQWATLWLAEAALDSVGRWLCEQRKAVQR